MGVRKIEMKKQEDQAKFHRKIEATPGYLESLEEDAKIILAGDQAGRWKTLEEIEEERRQRRESV